MLVQSAGGVDYIFPNQFVCQNETYFHHGQKHRRVLLDSTQSAEHHCI